MGQHAVRQLESWCGKCPFGNYTPEGGFRSTQQLNAEFRDRFDIDGLLVFALDQKDDRTHKNDPVDLFDGSAAWRNVIRV